MNKSRMIFVATSIVATLTFFSLYAYVLVPVVLPKKEHTIITPPPDNGQQQNRELLGILFPPDSWVFGKIDMISFSDEAGCILSKDSVFMENHRVQASSCAVLWFPDNHKELSQQEKYRQAIVLETANFAELDFDGPFAFSGRTPQLTGGQLYGVVTIRSQMKKPDSSDDIKLTTSDVSFNFNRIQTGQQVDFNFGPNQGRGRDLTIYMGNTDESKKGEMPDTIKRIVLQELMELRLYVESDAMNDSTGMSHVVPVESNPDRHLVAYPQMPPQNDMFQLQPESSGTPPPGATQNRGQDGNTTPIPQSRSSVPTAVTPSQLSEVNIQCQGSVDLVTDTVTPEQWLLTFRDQVKVIRTNPKGASDRLNCQELIVTLGQKQDVHPALPLPQNESQKTADHNPLANFGSLSPLRVKALGTAGSPVIVQSPENRKFQAKGRVMTLDLVLKELTLTPYDPDTERSSVIQNDAVSVEYDKFKIEGKSLRYGYENGNGPGRLNMPWGGTLEGMTGNDADKPFKLSWSEGLEIFPDKDDPNLTQIQIRGKPEVQLTGMGTGTAEEILIWCDASKKTSSATRRTSAIATAGENFDVEFKTIVMQRNVRLKTDNGEIFTKELEINFQQPDTSVAATRSVSRYPGPQLRNPSSANNPGGKMSQMSIFGNKDGSKSTFTIRADKVEVLASTVGWETIVDQILMTKNVTLDEKTSDATQEAMHLSGQTVHITKPESEQMTVEIFGDSAVSGGYATFQGRGVMLLGANINVDREKNLFWIDGPGKLLISQQTVDSAGSRGGNSGFDKLFTTPGNTGSPKNQAVIIDWIGSMQFDGRQLWFLKDVNVNYSMMAINKSDSVKVRLTKPFRFFEKNSTDDIEPEWVEIRGNIDLERDSFAANNGGQLTHDHIKMTTVEIFPKTGAFKGLGPGSVSSIFMDTGDSAGGLLPNGTTAVRTSPTTTQAIPTNATPSGTSGLFGPGLKFMQCNFHQSVEGNYNTGQVTFNDRVVTVLCPVGSFRDVIDTNNTRKIVSNGLLIECNKLEIVQPPDGGGKTVDLKAEGNTRIEMTYDNRYYIASADKIKFEQAKNLVTLEGNRYSGVELYEGANPGAPMQKLPSSERTSFNPVTKEIRNEGLRM